MVSFQSIDLQESNRAVIGVSAVWSRSDAVPLILGLLGALWLVSPLWFVRTTAGQWRSRRREHFGSVPLSAQPDQIWAFQGFIGPSFTMALYGTIWYWIWCYKMCGTYDSVGYYVILYVTDTVMFMVLYDTVSECGFSHIFTSKGRGNG